MGTSMKYLRNAEVEQSSQGVINSGSFRLSLQDLFQSNMDQSCFLTIRYCKSNGTHLLIQMAGWAFLWTNQTKSGRNMQSGPLSSVFGTGRIVVNSLALFLVILELAHILCSIFTCSVGTSKKSASPNRQDQQWPSGSKATNIGNRQNSDVFLP